jgi:hypothetical protein
LTSVISVLVIGGSVRASACGRMIRRQSCGVVRPIARPASNCPSLIELMPPRKISAS